MTLALASTNDLNTGTPSTGETKVEVVGESFTNVVDSFSIAENVPRVNYLSELRDTVAVDFDSDIRGFLGRPMPMAAGNFALTDSGLLYSRPALESFLGNIVAAPKVQGRYLMRATVCLKLQVNANKFQQGRYMLGVCPLAGVSKRDALCRTAYLNIHMYSKVQLTQLPHVELDISKDSEVTLKFPYVSYTNGYALQGVSAGSGESAQIFIYAYSPLEGVTGSTTASYILYMWLEDVELEGICVPQMAFGEQKSQNIGPIESNLSKVSKSVGILSRIPLISSFTKPVSWVSSVLADAAHVWGWSRPKNLSPETRVIQNPYMSLTTVDNALVVAPLSLGCNNETQVVDGFAGSSHDELAIDYVKSKFAWTNTATWNVSDPADTQIHTYDVSPSNHVVTTSDGVLNIKSQAPVAALASIFRYYRGGQLLRLKFVKTDFHSGRLLIAFGPRNLYSNANAGLVPSTSPWVHREIVDIRHSNEIVVKVPYVAVTPWLPCNEATGTLLVSVVDQLKAPATVPQSIKVIMEWAGDDDLEFAIPDETNVVKPVVPLTPQMGEFAPTLSLGGSTQLKSTIIQHSACIGEKIVSLRSLLKRLVPWYSTPTASDTAIYHRAISCVTSQTSTYVNAEVSGWLCWIKSWYALERGSYRFVTRNVTNHVISCYLSTHFKVPTTLTKPFFEDPYGVDDLEDTIKNASCVEEFIDAGSNKPVIEIPFYSPTPSVSVALSLISDSVLGPDPANRQIPLAHPVLGVIGETEHFANIKMGAGDDFDLGCFVSIPPIFVSEIV